MLESFSKLLAKLNYSLQRKQMQSELKSEAMYNNYLKEFYKKLKLYV